MIINLEEQLTGYDRYNGGWVKSVTGLDKNYQNGYSLKGNFIGNKRIKNVNLVENELYLDCSIGGSRKNQEKNYHLFKLEDGKIKIIKTIEDGQQDWAVLLWEDVERELGLQKTKTELIFDKIKDLDVTEFISLIVKLNEEEPRFKMCLENMDKIKEWEL